MVACVASVLAGQGEGSNYRQRCPQQQQWAGALFAFSLVKLGQAWVWLLNLPELLFSLFSWAAKFLAKKKLKLTGTCPNQASLLCPEAAKPR